MAGHIFPAIQDKHVIMIVKTYGGALQGVDAAVITVEVNVDNGIGYHLVGLPDNAIKESHYRIAAALLNNGYRIPGKKITINMAPADLRKEGASYDLTLALGILVASGQIKAKGLESHFVMGELSLDGKIQPIKGVLPMVFKARQEGFKYVLIPKANVREAAIVGGITVLGVDHIGKVIRYFDRGEQIAPTLVDVQVAFYKYLEQPEFDFAEVRGQEGVKRCMEIAAAGGHNIILIGPPGAGKTMLAKRLPSILPPMTLEEALETTKIHSVVGRTGANGIICQRPFRSPHHTISDVALVGGGSYPQPGEISLSHNGVLFLDELPEFKRSVLEVMRQPLEDREVTISRARFTVTYPCSFMLVASMNPSPSGYFNEPGTPLRSTPAEMQRYLGKISGPLLDRIDMHIEVTPVAFDQLSGDRKGEGSITIRKRVTEAREFQTARFMQDPQIHYNAQMGVKQIRRFCKLEPAGTQLLKTAMDKLGLSARAYDRILKVSRTIADLEGLDRIKPDHIAEAIQYRSLDREGWLG